MTSEPLTNKISKSLKGLSKETTGKSNH